MLTFRHVLGLVTTRSSREANSRKSSVAYRRTQQIIVLVAALGFTYSAAYAQAPAAPTTLTATTYSKKQIDLGGNDPNLGGASYNM